MNRVGHAGRGESVWLGWFLVTVLNEFAPICERRGRSDLAQSYRDEAHWLTGMLELRLGRDWYRRAYFDDGTPLGSAAERRVQADSRSPSRGRYTRRRRGSGAGARAMDAVRSRAAREE